MLRFMCTMALAAGVTLVASSSGESSRDVEPAGGTTVGVEMTVTQASPDRERAQRPHRSLRRDGDAVPRAIVGKSAGGQRWSPEEMERALEILQQIDAERAAPLLRLREDNPAGFERAFAARGHLLKGLLDLEQRDPVLFELRLKELQIDAKARRVAARVRAARAAGDDSAAAVLEDELRVLVSEQVDYGLRARAMEIVLLAEHLESLRDQLQVDSTNQARRVEMQVQKLLAADSEAEIDASAPRAERQLDATPTGDTAPSTSE